MTTPFTIAAAESRPGPAWLVERRRAAADRFAAAELPTAEQEEWRYSRIGDLDLAAYEVAPTPSEDLGDDLAGLVGHALDDATVVVTRDGESIHQRLGAGAARLDDLDDAPPMLGHALRARGDALVELHDAFASPLSVSVPEGADGGTVVVVHEAASDGAAGFPRLVVHAGAASTVTVVEVFISADGRRTLSFPAVELVADRDATLRHASVQVLGDLSWQIGRVAAVAEQNATIHSGTAAFGGDYTRLRSDTTLAGRGAHGELHAAYFGTGSQLLDFRTFQDHVAPDTTSNLLFKGALGEKGASVYTGLIKIRPDARGAQAFQTNRNLKLSDDAWAESVPNLEIENNEVQCSHASTVGPVDAEQRFYLESRGVPTDRAERLIVKGVFDEVLAALELGGYAGLVGEHLDRDLERSLS